MRPITFAALIALSLLTASITAAQSRITEAADLGTFGGVQTEPTAINNRGEIVGFVRNATGNSYDAFLWTPEFGYERIVTNPEGSNAWGINERGQVVGDQTFCIVEPNSVSCGPRGFVWSRRKGLQDLGLFFPRAINNRGEMAGSCDETGKACVMRQGTITTLESQFWPTYALGINGRGDVVGYFQGDIDFGPWRALFWPRSGGVIDLGEGVARDINNQGTIVGERRFMTFEGEEPTLRAFARVWTRDGVLEPEGSAAPAINNRGWVLVNGSVWNSRTGSRVVLASSYGRGTIPIDINERGEVVGLADTGTTDPFGAPVYHVVIWRVSGSDMRAGSQ